MEKENMDFSLSLKSLEDIPFDKYENDFTIIVNNKKYQISRIVADLISPHIRKLHYVDESINEFSFTTKNDTKHDYFQDFLNLVSFEETKIDPDHQTHYSEYFYQLGNLNEYFRLQTKFFSEINSENAVDRLLSISNITEIDPEIKIDEKSIQQLIDFISENFENVNKDRFKLLKLEFLEEIIENEKLRINDEDSLMNFILSLYEDDRSYSFLFESVLFFNISKETLEKYTISKGNASKDFLEFIYQQGENEFKGIMNHLNEETGSNIHDNGTIEITSNSIGSDDIDYHPKNIIDYHSNNFYYSKDIDNTFICFDFKDKLVQLSSYLVKSFGNTANFQHLRNWVVEGSMNGDDWQIIDRHDNDPTLNGSHIVHSFDVNDEKNDFYRFIRLRQIGNSWCHFGNHSLLALDSIEFYGKLKKQN
ncbi:hypothetical protein M9Y10_031655 [Tritrichomonas musculus]|uniref:F5/8 type C domain-containing protein n=1 Tax=Tritrichomonas musculus TaxID=1915356 RepID=A0ABR2H1B3_9EUKA